MQEVSCVTKLFSHPSWKWFLSHHDCPDKVVQWIKRDHFYNVSNVEGEGMGEKVLWKWG